MLLISLGSYTRLDNNILLSSHAPLCILLHTDSPLMITFPGLPPNVYPVFPVKSTVTAKNSRLNRKQIRITPGFAYIEYKVQGATFKSAVLDLRRRSKKKIGENHKRFCSTYVQLSRLQSLEGISLLQPIELDDINNQPHHGLQAEDNRLQLLSEHTLLSFTRAAKRRRQLQE